MRRAKQLPLSQLQPYLFELPNITADAPTDPISWGDIFGNDAPVEIEIGFGKGLFLINSAMQRPDVNFFGIEIERKYQLFTANRIAKRELSNVRLACADARDFFTRWIPDQSVQAIYIFFPDPWWKKRHRKRRLFTDSFVKQCGRVLKVSGQLYVVSDVEEYFEEIRHLLDQLPVLESRETPTVQDAKHELDFLTNFERKFRKENRPIHRVLYTKSSRAENVQRPK